MTKGSGDPRKKAFGKAMKDLKEPFLRCYAPGDSCAKDPIRAHSVQNASVLELIQENGHVYAPKVQLSLKEPRLEFGLVGRNLATTFHGLCNEHDTEIFRAIEAEPLNLASDEHLFLLAYRAVLKETHATAKAAIDTQAGYEAGVEEGIFPDEPCAPGMLAVEHMMLAHATHMHKLKFDRAFQDRSFGVFAHRMFDLDTEPTLAASALLSTGRWCSQTDSPSYATINVLPFAGTTKLIVSCLTEHEPCVQRTFLRFLSRGDLHENTSYLVLKRCDNFVIRPSVFDALSGEQKEECQRLFSRNIGPTSYEPKDRRLVNVFAHRTKLI